MTSGLPRFPAWLLRRRLPADWHEFVLGDLEEEFASRAARSPHAARLWLWKQTVRCLASPPRSHNVMPPLQDSPTTNGDSMIRMLTSDVRYAFRVLFRAPAFA